MFKLFPKRRADKDDSAIRVATLAAIDRSQAIIEFAPDGTILAANANFLAIFGYRPDEIEGRHHRILVTPEEAASPDYAQFWEELAGGRHRAGEFRRVGRNGQPIYLETSYDPVRDEEGRTIRIVEVAADITARKLEALDHAAQIAAIDRSQAVIEFELDGTIRRANANFKAAMGYEGVELAGRHHSMFVDPAEAGSAAYRDFWARLGRGEYLAGEFGRVARDGRAVYIQASYNPVFGEAGEPVRIVKIASDVTPQVVTRMQGERVRGLMENVAAGAEELDASVQEIAQSMRRSRETARTTYEQVVEANESTARLSSAAGSMGGIIELIKGISEQVNLLALNATIEAARAGEAGRGFAVVAGEVKNLARQTKDAAERIGGQLGEMSSLSDTVVAALDRIQEAIAEVQGYVDTTATAVEEQSAVTRDMSAGMQQAAIEAARIGAEAA